VGYEGPFIVQPGVQPAVRESSSTRNQQEDFSQRKAQQFILTGNRRDTTQASLGDASLLQADSNQRHWRDCFPITSHSEVVARPRTMARLPTAGPRLRDSASVAPA